MVRQLKHLFTLSGLDECRPWRGVYSDGKMKELHLQFDLTPRRSLGSQLPTNADVVIRLLMIRVEKMEEHSVDERRVPMTKCMTGRAGNTRALGSRFASNSCLQLTLTCLRMSGSYGKESIM